MFGDLFRLKDWYIIIPLGLAGLALGAWGFVSCSIAATPPSGVVAVAGQIGMALAKAIGLIFLRGLEGDACVRHQPWQLAVAQFMLPAIALVGGAKLFLANLRSDVRVALAQGARNHVIVCGLGDIGRQVVEGLRDTGRTVVAITLDLDEPNALHCEQLGVAVLKADAAHADILRHAGVARASAIVTATGSDAKNLEIGLRAAELVSGRRNAPLKVLAEVRSGWLMDRLLSDTTSVLSSPGADFQVFNLQANAARSLLRSPGFERAVGGMAPGASPHFIVAGCGRVGNEFVRRAICSRFAIPGVRPHFTIFDERAVEAEAMLRQRAPGLMELADFTFHRCHFGVGDLDAPASIQSHLERDEADAVVIAITGDEAALHTAFQFRSALDRRDRLAVPVFVRLREEQQFGRCSCVRWNSDPLLPDRLAPFGNLRDLSAPEVLLDGGLDRMARTVHEIYLEHQPSGALSPANVAWERLPEVFKASNRNVADHIAAGVRFAGYRLSPRAATSVELDAEAIETLSRSEHWRSAARWARRGLDLQRRAR